MTAPQSGKANNHAGFDGTLPELRQELRIESGAVGSDGSATWTVIDPIQHTYIQIDQTAYHLLSRWRPGLKYEVLAETVENDFGESVTPDEIAEFVRFVVSSNLVVEPEAGWRQLAARSERTRQGWLIWLMHNYLYLRVPLLRPERMLKRLLRYVAPLYTRGFFWTVVLSGAAGLYLVSRQWDTFYHTFQYFFSWQGAASYVLALIFIKSAHELGHAFTATRFGCRVPSMGICFLVMFPMLYTDVTDAWRLRNRRERLLIGAAGVAVELSIACFATLAWSFLPDGIVRSIAFFLATAAWILSLAINFNPLMRFDGYYLLSDFLGVDNLQTRAFAFGRWRMREILFGLGRPAPEALPQKTARILIVYAWCVWIYRLILFTGIAVLVYHFAFKVLGIVLFAVEIIYFVVAPIVREMLRWYADGASIRATVRTRVSALAVLLAILVASIPWSTTISVPAVIESSDLARVYPNRAGLVEAVFVKAGDVVGAGDPLLRLKSAELDHAIELTDRKIDLVRMRLARRISSAEDRTTSLVLEQELRALNVARDGLRKELADLTVTSSTSGHIVQFNSEIHPGRTISRSEFVALIKGGDSVVARGYVSEADIARIEAGTAGRFVPEEPDTQSIPVTVHEISAAGAANIEIPELASVHGGPIAVRRQKLSGKVLKLTPVSSSYLATFDAAPGISSPDFSLRGTVVLHGKAESFAGRALRRIAAVLVRESGF